MECGGPKWHTLVAMPVAWEGEASKTSTAIDREQSRTDDPDERGSLEWGGMSDKLRVWARGDVESAGDAEVPEKVGGYGHDR